MAAKKPAKKVAARKPDTTKDGYRTVAHLMDSAQENLAHASRHVDAMGASRTKASAQFNKLHAKKHVNDAAEHLRKAKRAAGQIPGVNAEFKAMRATKKKLAGY